MQRLYVLSGVYLLMTLKMRTQGLGSQREERDGVCGAKRRASLRLGWIASVFWAAFTLTWN